MSTMLILIGGHLCTAPRPQKEAATLVAAGHQVIVAGVWFDPELVERDRALLTSVPYQFQPVLDFRPGQSARFGVRLQATMARQLYRHWQCPTPALLGYGSRALLRFARQTQADLTIVHSEAGLWVGSQLLQQGYRVGVDFEDWFSHDLLPSAQATRPVAWLESLEATLMRHATYRLTTSYALANALAHAHHTSPPTVVYNVFPQAEAVSWGHAPGHRLPQPAGEHPPASPIRLHWFSQTIGPGRGLETLWAALPQVTVPVEIHLRGNCSPGNRAALMAQIPLDWHSRVYLHPTVSNAELPTRIAEYDIGLALEDNTPPSRNLTVTNKLFQYLQAGLAVLATDTAGQCEIFHTHPDIGLQIPCQNPAALAASINHLASQPAALHRAQVAASQAAQTRWHWESEQTQVQQAAQFALSQPPLVPSPSSPLFPRPYAAVSIPATFTE